MPPIKPLAEVSTGYRAILIVAVAMVAFYAWGLGAMFGATPGWLIDSSGHPRTNEFVGVRAAGELALRGEPAASYDWARHEAQMALITGRPVTAYFPWGYPPTYLLVAVLLALPPFLASALLWIAATGLLYAVSAARVAGLRGAGLLALASPATAFNAFAAHTGFWTAGASGLALHWLNKRPLLAGLCVGLLTFKPQLGVLLPVALVAGGHRRAIGAAVVSSGILIAASVLCFGLEPWSEFAAQMGRIGESTRFGHPRFGDVNFNLLVTTYGCLRAVGVADGPAMAAQGLAGLSCAALVWLLWRSRAPFELKAAGLVSAGLLATPYLFIYDLTHLSIAVAFLVAHTGLGGLSRVEVAALAGAMAMILLTAFLPLPLGFLANLHAGVVILARTWPYIAGEARKLGTSVSRSRERAPAP